MNKWVKIKDEVFYIEDISMQLTIGAHSSIDMSIDLQKYPEYSDIFFNKFERCDYTDMTPIAERREILIDDILNNKDNHNIN